MTPARRAVLPAAVLLVAALAGCGSSSASPKGVASAPDQTLAPITAAPTPSPTPSPTAAPTAAPTPTPTPTPAPTSGGIIPSGDANGATDLGAYLYPSSTGIACGARTGHYDPCPVTSRLAQRLDSQPTPHAEPLCRCQNQWQQSSFTATQTPDATVWIVHVVLTFGPGVTVTIDLRALRTAGGWLGDDTTCSGQDESTSIYAQNPPPCPGT